MDQLLYMFLLIASMLAGPQPVAQQVDKIAPEKAITVKTSEPFRIRYGQAASGREVQVAIDGEAKTTFAGKLIFGDGNSTWTSVCADVRAPISNGQTFAVRSRSSRSASERVARAGNIVAKYFKQARTPDQCAALQLAVWEALEDGGDKPNFYGGHFQARASKAVMDDAEVFYDGIWVGDEAVFFEAGQGEGGGQGQLTAKT